MTARGPKECNTRTGAVVPRAASTSLSAPAKWFVDWSLGNQGGSQGPAVNEYTALKYTVFCACVHLLAKTESTLPLVTYRESGSGRARASDLNVYGLLKDEYNPRMSSSTARMALTGHLLTGGNEFTQVVRNKSGTEVLELNPIPPDLVQVRMSGRTQVYDVYDRETRRVAHTVPAADMLHVLGPSYDGVIGYSPVRLMKGVIRAGLGAQEESEKFVTSGFRPPGAVKFPAGQKFASEQEAIAWRNRFQTIHANQNRVVVLENGADWVKLGIDPESAQMIESQQYTALQVCGAYQIPPHMVGLIEKSTSWGTGIEEQVDGFIKFALRPWLVLKEQEQKRKLFGAGSDVYTRYNLDALERANLAKRTEALMKQAQFGAISRDEWRALEERNPAPGGDVCYYPLNLGRTTEDGEDIAPPEPGAGAGAPGAQRIDLQALAGAIRRSFAANLCRCLRKETERAKALAKKPASFVASAEEFYTDHRSMVEEHVRGPLETWMASFPSGAAPLDWPAAVADAHCRRSLDELLSASECPAADLPAAVEQVTKRWLTERPAEVAATLQILGA